MSRWLNEPIAVGVGTREIVVGARGSRFARLRKLRKSASAVEPVRASIRDDLRLTEAGLLDALRAALEAHAEKTDQGRVSTRDARLVLDDFWGDHAILHGDFRRMNRAELVEIVLAHFADTRGDDGGTLLVRFSVRRGGRVLFASAISRALHDGIFEMSALAHVGISRLTLCLPHMLDRVGIETGKGNALLMFVSDELMQAVISESGNWVAYDAQRLFSADAGDASRLAVMAEQMFERSATKAGLTREGCRIYLFGNEIDVAPFEARFAAAIRPVRPSAGRSPAERLMESAQ
ncbi:hypothetical protein WS71_22050 [Burkholderia mayonis]|uniref:Uncharacterized protein n=1 Tax=Burkholderia mayonis TaxID=1385591 RepID=A0A1B4G7J7_9BURK|nr:hypothetical protein WS71_22050 [Burkholderia mayonis]KVE58696.1 hypothetical protein WS71_24115 [Burkholderia mayonis]